MFSILHKQIVSLNPYILRSLSRTLQINYIVTKYEERRSMYFPRAAVVIIEPGIDPTRSLYLIARLRGDDISLRKNLH